MRVGHRTFEYGQPGQKLGACTQRVRTHRSSDVNRDEEFLLALVSFAWRGIRSQSLRLREIYQWEGCIPSCSSFPVINHMSVPQYHATGCKGINVRE